MPQKTTASPGASTSGTAEGVGCAARLCRFGLARVETRLEREPDPLGQRRRRLGSTSGRPAGTTLTVSSAAPPAVAAEVALFLAQRPQPLHGANGRRRSGRYRLACVSVRARSLHVRRLARPRLGRDERPRRRAAPERGGRVDARAPPARRALPLHAHELPLPRPSGRPRAGRRAGRSTGVVTRREEDGRFAFVEIARRPRRHVRLAAAAGRDSGARREGRARLLRRRLADREARLPLDRQRRGPLVSATLLDVTAVRSRFTALQRRLAFFDGPGGTQCPDEVIDAIAGYLRARQRERRRAVRDVAPHVRARRPRPREGGHRSSAAPARRWRSARA